MSDLIKCELCGRPFEPNDGYQHECEGCARKCCDQCLQMYAGCVFLCSGCIEELEEEGASDETDT